MQYNKKNKDRSVNSYQDTNTSGTGYSVSFSDPNFLDQIEEDILPAVIRLNYMGYLTITSCHGHGLFNYIFNYGVSINLGPNITIQINKESEEQIKKHFNTFFIKVVTNDSMDEIAGVVNLRITSRYFISHFVTNKFLCKKIIHLVEEL
jgi:hypothetical protein